MGLTRLFLSKGADIDREDTQGWTALHCAAEQGHSEVLTALLRAGADINHQAYAGQTSLQLATRRGQLPVDNLLLASGAKPNAQAFDGCTPLHAAVQMANADIVARLIKSGADPTIRAHNNPNAYEAARDLTILEVLFAEEFAPETLLRKSIGGDSLDSMTLLISSQPRFVGQSYSWVTDLIDDGFSAREVADLLLKSENLQWMRLESPVSRNMSMGSPKACHHESCAHRVVSNAPLSASLGTDELGIAAAGSSAESKDLIEDFGYPLMNPAGFLQKLEDREQELLHICGIGGVLSPSAVRNRAPDQLRFAEPL